MPPNTSPEKCSVIVTIYKYFKVESEKKHRSIAGKNIAKSQKYVSSACILVLIDYIFVYYTFGSITFFLNSIYIATVENVMNMIICSCL